MFVVSLGSGGDIASDHERSEVRGSKSIFGMAMSCLGQPALVCSDSRNGKLDIAWREEFGRCTSAKCREL